jgi:hypothetical protein
MAKVRNNIVIRGLSGDLGKQLRIRTGPTSGRTNVCAIPEFHRSTRTARRRRRRSRASARRPLMERPTKRTPSTSPSRRAKKGRRRTWPWRTGSTRRRSWRSTCEAGEAPGGCDPGPGGGRRPGGAGARRDRRRSGYHPGNGPGRPGGNPTMGISAPAGALRERDRDRLRQGPARECDTGKRQQEAAGVTRCW